MKNRKKSQKIFECKICDYSTSNKYDYNKHLLTLKHKKMIQNGQEWIHICRKSIYVLFVIKSINLK